MTVMNDSRGVSTTQTLGQEQYEKFRLGRVGMVFQYDFRDKDGELFTTVAPKLKTCRERRDAWLEKKNDLLNRSHHEWRPQEAQMLCVRCRSGNPFLGCTASLEYRVGDITLNSGYWDCECIEQYIHPKADYACLRCQSKRDDQPDSRANEVIDGKEMAR